MNILRILVIAVVLIGCSDKPAKLAAGDECGAITRAVARVPEDERLRDDYYATHLEACKADGWSADVLRCIGGASSTIAIDRCLTALTPDQRQKLLGRTLMLEVPPPPPPPPPPDQPLEPAKPAEEPDVRAPGPPGPPSPPQNVAPTALERTRIAGDKQIVPDDDTRNAIAKSGKEKIVASFKLCITETGTVASIETLRSSGFAAYDDKITKTITETWKYRPRLVNGKPQPVCTAVTFIYSQA